MVYHQSEDIVNYVKPLKDSRELFFVCNMINCFPVEKSKMLRQSGKKRNSADSDLIM